jgi:hypothetical protein
MFAMLGFGVAVYTLYAAVTGAVYAKSGPGGEEIRRDESPGKFWTVIAIYGLLSLALVTVF